MSKLKRLLSRSISSWWQFVNCQLAARLKNSQNNYKISNFDKIIGKLFKCHSTWWWRVNESKSVINYLLSCCLKITRITWDLFTAIVFLFIFMPMGKSKFRVNSIIFKTEWEREKETTRREFCKNYLMARNWIIFKLNEL